MTTDGIMQGLGSMSGLLIIISIITVGMIMAIRNKKAKFKEGRNKPKPETQQKVESQPERQPESNTEQKTNDVDSLLEKLKEDVKQE
jgi:hypothetical protein|tara:strand:+ start:590 stop:850 length:261 start_codon:yes stop_codon:yes gene_type:complete